MSDSRRRPYATDSRNNRWREKRLASKAARRQDYGDGNHYRRFYQSYFISDYSWYMPESVEAYRK